MFRGPATIRTTFGSKDLLEDWCSERGEGKIAVWKEKGKEVGSGDLPLFELHFAWKTSIRRRKIEKSYVPRDNEDDYEVG